MKDKSINYKTQENEEVILFNESCLLVGKL